MSVERKTSASVEMSHACAQKAFEDREQENRI